MLDVIPLIAIPLVILAHWRRVLQHESWAVPYRSPDRWRMSDSERVATLIGTLMLFVNLVVVIGRAPATLTSSLPHIEH